MRASTPSANDLAREQGFIALITVLILSVVLMVGVISLSQFGVITRYSLLDIENKMRSENLANACISFARLSIVTDPDDTITNKDVPLGEYVCRIESLVVNSPTNGTNRVKVSAAVSGATTNYQVDVNTTTGAITRFIEVAN